MAWRCGVLLHQRKAIVSCPSTFKCNYTYLYYFNSNFYFVRSRFIFAEQLRRRNSNETATIERMYVSVRSTNSTVTFPRVRPSPSPSYIILFYIRLFRFHTICVWFGRLRCVRPLHSQCKLHLTINGVWIASTRDIAATIILWFRWPTRTRFIARVHQNLFAQTLPNRDEPLLSTASAELSICCGNGRRWQQRQQQQIKTNQRWMSDVVVVVVMTVAIHARNNFKTCIPTLNVPFGKLMPDDLPHIYFCH